MSRVAAWITDDPNAEAVVKQMLRRMPVACRAEEVVRLEGGALGASQVTTVARVGVGSLALDGTLYHAPHGINQAAWLLERIVEVGFAKAIQESNGSFAILWWDAQRRELWAARDRFGIKPLYYRSWRDQLAIASLPQAFGGLPDFRLQPRAGYLARYVGSHYRYIDNEPELSPYEGLEQLAAGHWLCYRVGERPRLERYWGLEERPSWEAAPEQLAAEYRELLMDAVAIRQRHHPEAAFTLSGGLDSSSVLSCAALLTGRPQPALSAVYEDKTYDETEEIQPMLGERAHPWTPIRLDNAPDVFGLIGEMVRLHGEPVATATWLSHYVLTQRVAEMGVQHLFGGLGGDELNAGEYEYFFFHFADVQQWGCSTELETEIAAWAQHHDHPIFRKNREVAMAGLERMVDATTAGRCLVEPHRYWRYSEVLTPEYRALLDAPPRLEHPFTSYLRNRTYQDLFYETAPCCLRAEDRHGTALGVEHVLPFFDHRLVEFMFRVPNALKIHRGVTKILLREAMHGVLPEETRTRIKKTGWNAPAHRWFSGANADQLRDIVRSQRFREWGVVRPDEVLRLVDEHEAIVMSGAARENHMMFLWQLTNAWVWRQALAI